MKFSTWMPARVDWAPVAQRAERLGFDYVYQADSQMVYADSMISLALVAQATQSIRLGTGVTNPRTRSAPAMASALATLNQIAPGRVFLAIGTGYTSMESLGLRSATVAQVSEYVRVVRALLQGERAEFRLDDQDTVIQMLNGDGSLDDTFVNLRDAIPIWIAAHGPRMLELAGEVGDGVVLGVVRPTESYMARLRASLQRGADRVGRSAQQLPISLMVNMYVQGANEKFGSEPMRQAVMGLEQSSIATYAAARLPKPGSVKKILDDEIPSEYRALALAERKLDREAGFGDDSTWYLRAYDGHGWRLRPELLPLVSDDMLRSRALIGTSDEILLQLREWESFGISVVGSLAQGSVELAQEQLERFGSDVLARY